jgi:hypothetical protein
MFESSICIAFSILNWLQNTTRADVQFIVHTYTVYYTLCSVSVIVPYITHVPRDIYWSGVRIWSRTTSTSRITNYNIMQTVTKVYPPSSVKKYLFTYGIDAEYWVKPRNQGINKRLIKETFQVDRSWHIVKFWRYQISHTNLLLTKLTWMFYNCNGAAVFIFKLWDPLMLFLYVLQVTSYKCDCDLRHRV